MAKKRKNYDVNHRVVRVQYGDYALIRELSIKHNISIAEVMHAVIAGNTLEKNNREKISPAQISMPVKTFISRPISHVMVRSTPIKVSFSREVEHVDGNRQTD